MNFENDIRSRAEQLVLASLLSDNGSARHLTGLRPEHFSHDTHGQIFRTMVELLAKAERVTPESVASTMQGQRKLRNAGLYAYLNALTRLPARPANSGYYAATMRSHGQP